MKKILFAILASFVFCGAMQAQSSYKVLNIIKDGVAVGKYKLSEIDCLTVTTVERHEYVDLGLPSGTLWATTNIGAVYPADYGDYFSWGETQPKVEYNAKTYKWGEPAYGTLTKYCTNSNHGVVDNKTQLEAADDAATANWGSDWFIPTKTQWDELINSDNTTWTWVTQTNSKGESVKGYQVVSKLNGKSIFLPAGGWARDKVFDMRGVDGSYLSSSLYTSLGNAYYCGFDHTQSYVSSCSRSYGHSVRPVRMTEDAYSN